MGGDRGVGIRHSFPEGNGRVAAELQVWALYVERPSPREISLVNLQVNYLQQEDPGMEVVLMPQADRDSFRD